MVIVQGRCYGWGALSAICLVLLCAGLMGCAARLNGLSKSSEEIAKNVQSEVAMHPDISDYSLRVNVRGGHVTLGGNTKNLLQSSLIESVAVKVPGVRGVTNEIVVTGKSSDEEIKEAILQELEYDGSLFIDTIEIHVRDGVVTLVGSLPDRHAVDDILSHVLNAEGVRDIESKLTINGQPYPIVHLTP